MWLGCQSRRFNCLFWRETRQRILGHEISPYPEVGRDAREAVDDANQQRAVGGWTAEKRATESWRLYSREASSRELAWKNGQGAVNTGHRSREARQHGIGSSESESR